jgi:hypothetical protein
MSLSKILVLSIEEFEEVKATFSETNICGMDNSYGLFTCLCDEVKLQTYPDISIQIETNAYKLPRQSYIQRVKAIQND